MVFSQSQKQWGGFAVLGMLAVFTAAPARAFDVEVSEAPTSDLALTLNAIHGAQQSLLLNIYELSSSDIADALIERIQAGIHVEIIEEGQPVGGLSAAAKGIEAQIAQAMRNAGGNDHLYQMGETPTSARRYRFDHAKYAVIDGDHLLIGSENYSPTGNPQPGTKGNRGWEVVIHDPEITQEFQQIFATDSDMSHGDLTDLVSGASGFYSFPSFELSGVSGGHHHPRPTPTPTPTPTLQPQPQPQPTLAPQPSPSVAGALQASAVTRITSPDTSRSGLVDMINSATTSLDIEQMTFDSAWGNGGGNSPMYDAVLAAAQRGVKVRILLNDERVFDHASHPSVHKNQITADALNQAAQQGNLDLTVRIANLSAMGVDYIHNKGALIDSDKTLISSINWDENSVEHNREAAVLITSPDVHSHYEALFQGDWDASANGPGAATNPQPAPQFVANPRVLSDDLCPDQLRLVAQLGALAPESDDPGFAALSGARIASTFNRVTGAEGCLLSDAPDARSNHAERARFLQIRERTNGDLAISLEGYTSTGKLFSIRTLDPAGESLDGRYDAAVYDGSGPGRPKMGMATLSISGASTH